jgi:hypothetical protein
MSSEQLALAVDVKLEFLDSQGKTVSAEQTVTDLIMRNGARVLTCREVSVGEFLVIKTSDGMFESPAVVKGSQLGEDRIPRLTLEFTGNEWQRRWLFPKQPENPELYYEEFLQLTKETSMLLQIIIADLESEQSPDQVFLSELKGAVDELRTIIFRIQKSASGD